MPPSVASTMPDEQGGTSPRGRPADVAPTPMSMLLGSLAKIRGFVTEREQDMWGHPSTPRDQSLWSGEIRPEDRGGFDPERDDQELRHLYDLRVQVACLSLSRLTDDDITRLAVDCSLAREDIDAARDLAAGISADGYPQRLDAARQLFDQLAPPIQGSDSTATDLLDELRKGGQWPGDPANPIVRAYSALLASAVLRHAPFARWRATQMVGEKPSPLTGLAALEGLRKALERFRPEFNVKITTYAGHWVRHRVDRVFADFGTDVRAPVHLFEDRKRVRRIVRGIVVGLGSLPDHAALIEAGHSRMPNFERFLPGAYAHLRDAWSTVRSDGRLEIDCLFDEQRLADRRLELRAALGMLLRESIPHLKKKRQPEIIERRYALNGRSESETLDAIGQSHGITRERIRQLEEQALEQLGSAIGKRVAALIYELELVRAPNTMPLN